MVYFMTVLSVGHTCVEMTEHIVRLVLPLAVFCHFFSSLTLKILTKFLQDLPAEVKNTYQIRNFTIF